MIIYYFIHQFVYCQSLFTKIIRKEAWITERMTSLRELLAFNIKNKRRELGLTQTKLAEKVDAAPTYIAMIELCKRFPSVDMLERIATALEIDPPELFAVGSFHIKSVEELHAAVLLDIKKVISDRIQGITRDERPL